MSADVEIENIESRLELYASQAKEVDLQEAMLNAQIASIRLQIAKLHDNRREVRIKIKAAELDKESAARKLELENEALRIQQSIAEKRAEVEALIADAPWRDVAFDWQIDGMVRLPERALLADKRGMGKTLSAIIWRRLNKSKRTLVCLRKEVASDFIKEINTREPGLFVYNLISATPDQRDIAAYLLNNLGPNANFVVVTNIESWRRNVEKTTEALLSVAYDAIILDEAHHIKNSSTGTAQGFFKLAERIPKVLELTGTPIKNRPQEMFSLLHALYPNIFPRENKFLFDYCVSVGQNKWAFSPQGVKNLVDRISPFYLARSPDDIGRKVPPPRMIEYKLNFDNHEAQREAYKAIAERSMAIINSDTVVPIVSQLAVMTRLAQTVSWPCPIHFEDPDTGEVFTLEVPQSVKMDWAEELIQELVEEGERIVMFSRFKPAIYEMKRRLELDGLRVAVITGDEKAKGNTEMVFNDFDLKTADPDNYKFDVLLATYQTVGESANLNAARHMILYDRFWNPGNDDQAIGRIDRINSIDQATVHLPQVETSIDDYMVELIGNKRNMVADFKDAAEAQASLLNHLRNSL